MARKPIITGVFTIDGQYTNATEMYGLGFKKWQLKGISELKSGEDISLFMDGDTSGERGTIDIMRVADFPFFLTKEEIEDNARALVIAMQTCDANNDTALANRLEKLKDKIDSQRH